MTLYIVGKINLSLEEIAKNLVANYGNGSSDFSLHCYFNYKDAYDYLTLDLQDPQELKYKLYKIHLSEQF